MGGGVRLFGQKVSVSGRPLAAPNGCVFYRWARGPAQQHRPLPRDLWPPAAAPRAKPQAALAARPLRRGTRAAGADPPPRPRGPGGGNWGCAGHHRWPRPQIGRDSNSGLCDVGHGREWRPRPRRRTRPVGAQRYPTAPQSSAGPTAPQDCAVRQCLTGDCEAQASARSGPPLGPREPCTGLGEAAMSIASVTER